MIDAISYKERRVLGRERTLLAVVGVVVVLMLAGLATGVQREQVFDKEKAAAELSDKNVWMEQGARNPHSAAHFSRYAFRTSSPLALIDPGTNDFAGLAVWMEAHYQDPAVFRRAEDGGELSRYAQMTPAFLLLAAAPLLVFLMMYGSMAAEREDGTLRQLLAAGLSRRDLFLGKLSSGLRSALLVFLAAFAVVGVLALLAAPGPTGGDSILRLVALFAMYAVYLSVFVALALGVSALFSTRQSAFLALAAVWVLATLVVPRFAADLGTSLTPQPDPREVAEQLRAASYTYYADDDLKQQVETEVLQEYGVDSVDALPINYGAYTLQVSEELSIPEFERVYADLDRQYAAQERTKHWFSVFTPTIAAGFLSQGIAGTDRHHQRDFALAAELHRRDMIKLLNDDYMLNAGDAGSAYTADAALWAQFEDFVHQRPRLAAVVAHYAVDAALLLLWLLAGLAFAHWAVGRAIRAEVSGQ